MSKRLLLIIPVFVLAALPAFGATPMVVDRGPGVPSFQYRDAQALQAPPVNTPQPDGVERRPDCDNVPHYPYPTYHNPYYTGVSGREMLSGAMDWVVQLPMNIVDRVSTFVDRRVFSHRGAPNAPAPAAAITPMAPTAAPGISATAPTTPASDEQLLQ